MPGPHTCATSETASCILVGKLTWHLAQRGSFIVSIQPDRAGGYSFTAFAFGRFTARVRCKKVPAAVASAVQQGVGWDISKAP